MADDRQVYSDEEFALILRKASELASRAEPSGPPSVGLTLTEMKAAAAQAGIDPALIERAARVMMARASASPMERLFGGPVRHVHEARFPMKLDEESAARLLSAVRIIGSQAGSRDKGHSSPMGVSWHDGGDMETLGVAARPVEGGTSVSIVLDRRGTLAILTAMSGLGMVFLGLFAVFALYPESPALSFGVGIGGVGGALAAARGYWASSSRRIRERINEVMDAIAETTAQSEASRPLEKAPEKVLAPPGHTSTID